MAHIKGSLLFRGMWAVRKVGAAIERFFACPIGCHIKKHHRKYGAIAGLGSMAHGFHFHSEFTTEVGIALIVPILVSMGVMDRE